MPSQQIIQFLNKYNITYMDAHTSIITQAAPSPSSLQSYQFIDNKINNNANTNAPTHAHTRTNGVSYLIKDMIIAQHQMQQDNVNNINSILQTLSLHQQLSNKYILTLLHHEIFVKSVPVEEQHVQRQQRQQRLILNADDRNHNSSNARNNGSNMNSNMNVNMNVNSNMNMKQSKMSNNTNNNRNIYNNNTGYGNSNNWLSRLKQNKTQIEESSEQHNQSEFSHQPLQTEPAAQAEGEGEGDDSMIEHTDNQISMQIEHRQQYSRYTHATQHLSHLNTYNHNNDNSRNRNKANTTTANNISSSQPLSSYPTTKTHKSQNAIRAIYEYGSLTLKQQICNRIMSSTQFEEEQLWAILATIIQALHYLQQQGIVYGVLGTDKIFINSSLVKILDPSATATDPLLISQGRLYSPQILNDQQDIDMFKSDVYIVGLIMLECGLLVDLSRQIEPNLNKYLDVFKEVYSKSLVDIVEICLVQQPKHRPTFQQLKLILAKELDMNDFSTAYDGSGAKILKYMDNDKQDIPNPVPDQIEIEFEECSHDVLYQSLNQDQMRCRKQGKIVTEYQRARIKYIGVYGKGNGNDNGRGDGNGYGDNSRQSRVSQDSRQHREHDSNYRSQSHKRKHSRHNSASPIQTRRNAKPNSINYYDNNTNNTNNNNNSNNSNNNSGNGSIGKLPNLNMAISQSVYDDIMPISNKNSIVQKTNRKQQKPIYDQCFEYNGKHKIGNKQNISNDDQQRNIKKTKLIKEKLVRHHDVDHTFGPHHKNKYSIGNNTNTNNSNSSNGNGNNSIYSNNSSNGNGNNSIYSKQIHRTKLIEQIQYKNNTNTNKYDGSGQSIQEQMNEQSQSSYLYYNTSSNSHKQNNIGDSIADSQISQHHYNRDQSNTHTNNTGLLRNSGNHHRANSGNTNGNTNGNGNSNGNTNSNGNSNGNTNGNGNTNSNGNSRNKQSMRGYDSNQGLFTDPTLMKTIKDDLARISTSKNMQQAANNRWPK